MDVAPQKQVKRIIKTVPDIDWVEIPAGEFIYGSDEEKNKETLYLDTFYISRYPITNMQYQTFVDDGGYEDERWWVGLTKPTREESEWRQGNRPKTNVDWYESIAYCRWLSEQMGFEITSPTEQQWEKTARGEDDREYPWGNEYLSGYANVDEKENKDGKWYLQQICAVGLYPHGDSLSNVADLSGNIWEWCLNKYHDEKDISINENKNARALRGGSWVRGPEFAFSTSHYWLDPNDRFNSRGFRVCCFSPSQNTDFQAANS